jgi:hypothetical protein
MTIEEENYWMEKRFGDDVEDIDMMRYRRMRIRNFHELYIHNDSLKFKRLLLGIGCAIFLYIVLSIEGDANAIFLFDEFFDSRGFLHRFVSFIFLFPIYVIIFSFVGHGLGLHEMSDKEWIDEQNKK